VVLVDFGFGVHPALVLTPDWRRRESENVTVVPGQTGRAGMRSMFYAGPEAGLDHETAFDFHAITTVKASRVGREIGLLRPDREREVLDAVARSLDLVLPETQADWA
jgi:mRNA-degrading endonuclease toxin of MazEF toxin-antitoxin module